MLDFISILKESFGEDVTTVETYIKTKWDKTVSVIKEAFSDTYTDRKLALYKIKNEFVNPKLAPKSVDASFVKENMSYIMNKIGNLSEGEIKIIINNDISKGTGGRCATIPTDMGVELEMESSKPKKKKKKINEVDTTIEAPVTSEPIEGDISTDQMADEDVKTVTITVDGTNVIVDPSEATGLTKSEYTFDDEDDATEFVENLKQIFTAFVVSVVSGTDNMENAESEDVPVDAVQEAKEEDATEEPEDSAEEPEDSAEEPEDSAEEPEDSINWQDVMDTETDEETSDMNDSITLNKILGKLVKINEGWIQVTGYDKKQEKYIGVNAKGEDVIFDESNISMIEKLEVLDESIHEQLDNLMEAGCKYSAEEEMAVDAEEEMDFGAEEEVEEPEDSAEEPEDSAEEPEDSAEEPEDAAEEEMEEPYSSEEEMDEPLDLSKDDSQYSESFIDMANRFLEEDKVLSPMIGLTSKPSDPPKKIDDVKKPKAEIKKQPNNSVTTAKPNKPPKKMEKVKKPATLVKKQTTNSVTTKTASKPKQKIDNVKSPEIPKEYK